MITLILSLFNCNFIQGLINANPVSAEVNSLESSGNELEARARRPTGKRPVGGKESSGGGNYLAQAEKVMNMAERGASFLTSIADKFKSWFG